MKSFLRKININLLWVAIFGIPLLLLTIFMGYKTIENFSDYKNNILEIKKLNIKKIVIDLTNEIAKERGLASIYLASKGKFYKKINNKKVFISDLYVNQQEEVNKLINEIKKIKIQNSSLKNKILNKLDELNYIRTEINKNITIKKVITPKVYTKLFDKYTNVISELINILYESLEKSKIETGKQYELETYLLAKKINTFGIIRGYVSFYTVKNVPLSIEKYKELFINKFPGSSFINDLKIYRNPNINDIIKKIKKNKLDQKITNILFNIQTVLQLYYDNPEEFYGYPIQTSSFFKVFSEYINNIKLMSEEMLKLKENLLKENAEKLNNLLINKILASSILLLILFVLGTTIFISNKYLKDLDSLMETLKTIITSDEEDEEYKIKEVKLETLEGIENSLEIIKKTIIETQKQKAKAEESVKAKSLFLANMSHEIRTPLNGILGFLELLEITDLTEEQKEYVNTIANSAKNLLQIVNNILDVSKIESNKVTLENIEFKLVNEIEETLEIFASPAAQKNIQYNIYIEPTLPSVVKGDILKIKEIFTNLVNNAIKFTPDNGRITIRIKSNGFKEGKLELYCEVDDTGIGMTESQKNKVFEAFSQADVSTSRKYGGTGLGLTIVKNYIEMMGGQINVESELNKGTKFYFNILLEVLEPNPKYLKGELKNKNIAVLNTNITDERRKDRYQITIEYTEYFGVSIFYVLDADELIHLMKKENIDALYVFYEETNKGLLKSIKNLNIPKIYISSYYFKEEIDEFLLNATAIYDPVLPYKILNAFENIDKSKDTRKTSKSEKKDINKNKYNLYGLIAEDNPINQKLLQTTLKQLGIETEIANNGVEAFNMYQMNSDKYDVIFMDVQMPVMDGTEATKEILEIEKEYGIPHTAIIAVTANALKGDKEKFLGIGMDDYISKPIVKNELIKVIENVIEGKYNNVLKSEIAKSNKKENEKEEKEDNELSSHFLTKYDEILIIDKYTNNIDELRKINDNIKQILSKKQLMEELDKNLNKSILLIINTNLLKEYEKLINLLNQTYKDNLKLDIILIAEDLKDINIKSNFKIKIKKSLKDFF